MRMIPIIKREAELPHSHTTTEQTDRKEETIILDSLEKGRFCWSGKNTGESVSVRCSGSRRAKEVISSVYSTLMMDLICSSETWLPFKGLQGITSQVTVLFRCISSSTKDE
jgi:hypothetical protein